MNEESGYRLYAHEQVFGAVKVRFLREAGFSIAMMEEVMTQYDSPQEAQRYFQIHMKELGEERRRISNALIRPERAQKLLGTENTFMKYTVGVEQIEGMYTITLHSMTPIYEHEGLIQKKVYSTLVEKHLDITFAQPQNARAYFFDEGSAEKNVDIEITAEAVGSYENVEDICFRRLEDEMVAGVTFTSDYSQITEIYTAITMWTKENGYKLDGVNFCIYHRDWEQCDNLRESMTEICLSIRK